MDHYYLIGSPIAHSLSPAMMNFSFRTIGLDADYRLAETTEAGVSAAVERFLREGAAGWNVTMPDKKVMAGLCDRLSPESEISGSVNTVKREGTRLLGYTTDGTGFLTAMKDAGCPLRGKKMTLLGTGGAACAILIKSALEGIREISVFYHRASSAERIREMAEKLKERTRTRICLFPLSDPERLRHEIHTSAALVNATSVGMKSTSAETGCLIPDSSFLDPDVFVCDIIYNPPETPLLRMADAAGCRTANGLSMLLQQGAASFRIWTNQEMPVGLVRREIFHLPPDETPS